MNPRCIPAENSPLLKATYRVGNGVAGNVGAESITRIIKPKIPKDNEFFAEHIIKVCNPLPSRGGADFETSDEVRQYAPQAFRIPERAVTEADYAEIIQREHSEVQRATAIIRWTGSWHTVFVTIDRYGGKEVDEEFKTELINLLNKYRLAGYDVEINGPIYVPVDVSLKVCVYPDQPRDEVKKRLTEAFSNKDLPDGRRGYFHPDNFTFGQPLYLSHINAEAKKIKGVRFVEFEKFQRLGKADKELEEEVIKVGQFEIIQLENDPNFPEKGKIEFIMEGGR
jgi:predicted phage baseplate assembly protein